MLHLQWVALLQVQEYLLQGKMAHLLIIKTVDTSMCVVLPIDRSESCRNLERSINFYRAKTNILNVNEQIIFLKNEYRIAGYFRGGKFSRISRIDYHS